MKSRGQLEDILTFFAVIFLILSALVYFVYFKTGVIPVYKPEREIKPAEKGIVPTGTFFIYPKKQTPYLFLKIANAEKLKLKPNKNIETYIYYEYPDLNNIETNEVRFRFEGKNIKDPNDRFYFMYILFPLDKEWQTTYFNEKYFYLPKGHNRYFLIVIAVNDKNEYDPSPAFISFTTKISPYFRDISIWPQGDKITLYINNYSNKEIDITNWKIISSNGIFTVPQGVKFVDPDFKYVKENIILPPYGRAKIIATSSPLGFSFRINKCFKFFLNLRNDVRKFVDFIPYYCKYFTNKELFDLRKQGFSINCLDFLRRFPCGPSFKDLDKIRNDSRCLNFIDSLFTYRGCYYNSINDKDFLTNYWIIFITTPTTTIYSPTTSKYLEVYKNLYETSYEEIKLYDNLNLLVNKYIYY